MVIGRPVEHSLSPVIHNAAFEALGLDWGFFALSVPPGGVADAVAAMRNLALAGMSVTMPHKDAVVDLVDARSPAVALLGAANCLWWRGAELVADNTDGIGFVDALHHDAGFEPRGRRAVVFGAGGAARAVIAALASAGAAEIVVVNRTRARAEVAASLAGPSGRIGTAEDVVDADMVVNASPVGMGDEALPFDPSLLGRGHLVIDLIYEPMATPLVLAARERGAVAINGLGMLIHQAAHAFRHWTGEDPPIEVMSASATAELARRRIVSPQP